MPARIQRRRTAGWRAPAGAVAHWRRGEPPCPACAAGETAYRAARRTAALPAHDTQEPTR